MRWILILAILIPNIILQYRGVTIGMSATAIRQKLGNPRLKDKSQDLFAISDNETAQFFH
jgi:hypothetical protein